MAVDLNMDFPARYRIQLHGAVDEVWFDYHDDMVIEKDDPAGKGFLYPYPDSLYIGAICSILYN